MSNLENTKLLEDAMEKYEDTQEKLRLLLNRVLDTAIGTSEAYRKIKETTIELQDFIDRVSAYAKNKGVYIQHAKGYIPPNDFNKADFDRKDKKENYIPPADSTGDILPLSTGYLKEVPAKYSKFLNK